MGVKDMQKHNPIPGRKCERMFTDAEDWVLRREQSTGIWLLLNKLKVCILPGSRGYWKRGMEEEKREERM